MGSSRRALGGLVLACLAQASSAQVLFVDADATGSGDGSSWADAHPDLGAALAAASPGSQLWVAEGVYLPPVPAVGDLRLATFTLPDGVELYGGFAGTESALAQRDVAAHASVLAGDLGAPGVDGDNAYHVVTAVGVTVRLDGVTVTAGRATAASGTHASGGGLRASQADVLLVQCTFADNRATQQGGALLVGGVLEAVGCTFTGNLANSGGAASAGNSAVTFLGCTFLGNGGLGTAPQGGALSFGTFLGSGSLTLDGCVFTNNGSGHGGAVMLSSSAATDPVRVRRCTFTGNTAIHGGALSSVGTTNLQLVDCDFAGNTVSNVGGAVVLWTGAPVIARCRFVGNQSGRGGALGLIDPGTFGTGSSPRVVDSLFSGNAALLGGAVSAVYGSDPRFVNCAFTGNVATVAGGAHQLEGGMAVIGPVTPTVTADNCILWGNSDPGGSDESAQFHVVSGGVFVNHSVVQGLTGAFGGAGNLDSDPLFVAPAGLDGFPGTLDDDLRPGPGSPCIDAGDVGLLLADLGDVDGDGDLVELQPLDLGGLLRVVDDPLVRDTGSGGPPVVDIGAHEAGSDLPADVWVDLGGGSPGVAGVPALTMQGTLVAGQPLSIELAQAPPNALMLFWVAVQSTPVAAFGGTLHAFPIGVQLLLFSDGLGEFGVTFDTPPGLPSDLDLFFQLVIDDDSTLHGSTLSNAMRGTTP